MNDILLYDSLSNQKKTFEPIDINNIRIYACGPTVYNFAHIGNARMAIVFDSFVRLFRAKYTNCLLYTSPSPRDAESSRMPSSA